MEQPNTKKKTNWNLVRNMLHGVRLHIFLGALYVLLATVFTYAVPYVTSFTLDYVIQVQNRSFLPSCWAG